MASLPLGPGVQILAQRDGLLALDKPAGLKSHPNTSGAVDAKALLRASYDLEAECYTCDSGRVWLVNRLDAPTSGVLLAATDAVAADEAKTLFAERQVEKVYLAWVKGRLGKGGRWRDRLQTANSGPGARTVAGAGDLAETDVEPVGATDFGGVPLTLLELRPLTGRTHQLRVQCAQRRLPIVGDATYGDFGFNRNFAKQTGRKRLYLHAWKVSLRFRGTLFSAESPRPEGMG